MVDAPVDEERDWTVRQVVYQHFVAHGTAPTAAVVAARLGRPVAAVQAAFERLDRRHALFLDPTDRTIRMAHPFSALPTAFRVHVNGRAYWANCAWDALGIPAALHADAQIDAHCAESDAPLALAVVAGQVRGADVVAHFPLPFRHWYHDLIDT